MNRTEKLKSIFKDGNEIAKTCDVKQLGFSNDEIARLCNEGILTRIKHGMFFPERCIGHLLKHSEHGPVVHVVSVDHGVPAFRGAVPLKENAAGCAPFPFIGVLLI